MGQDAKNLELKPKDLDLESVDCAESAAIESGAPGVAATRQGEFEPDGAEIKRALDRAFLETLRPASGFTIALIVLYTFYNLATLPEFAKLPALIADLSLISLFVGVRIQIGRNAISAQHAHSVGGLLILGLLAVNGLIFGLTANAWNTFDTMLIILAVGGLLLSARWSIFLMAVANLMWFAIAWWLLPHASLPRIFICIASVTGFSAILQWARIRAVRRLEILRIQDARRRRELEAALRATHESEERYRQVVDGAPMGISVIVEGEIVFVNKATIELIGATGAEDLIGRRSMDFSHPEDEAIPRKLVEELRSGKDPNPRDEMRILRINGETIHVEMTISLISFRGTQGIQVIYNDISQRKMAEAALRASEEQYRSLVEDASDPIYRLDVNGAITYMNQAGIRLVGYGDEILELTCWDIIRDDYREQLGIDIARHFGGKEKTVYVEFPIVAKGGREIWLGQMSQPIYGSSGKIVGFQAFSRDITDRIEAEQEKEKLEDQLNHAQRMDAIGTLAGGIAHDFNNLLSGILGYSNMLKERLDPNDPNYKAVSVIENAADRAANLTQQLLGFARKGKHQNTPVDAKEALREVMELLGRTIDKNIVVQYQNRGSHTQVMGDPDQIRQVILNLSLNARDSMPRGGKLLLELDNVEMNENDCISFPDAKPGRYLVLMVGDTGTGIPASIQEKIFDPFFTTKDQGKGSGMGLSMVYGTVKNHGGFICLYSEENVGTCFRVYLPLYLSEPEADVPSTEPQKLSAGQGRILVVDDEEVVRELVTDMLETLGYEVITAVDGQEAIEQYREKKNEIDLILLDMIMPRLGGKDCFMELKRMNPEVRAVLSTGYSRDGAAQEILDQGMMGFIQKPYRINQLSEVVSEAMSC